MFKLLFFAFLINVIFAYPEPPVNSYLPPSRGQTEFEGVSSSYEPIKSNINREQNNGKSPSTNYGVPKVNRGFNGTPLNVSPSQSYESKNSGQNANQQKSSGSNRNFQGNGASIQKGRPSSFYEPPKNLRTTPPSLSFNYASSNNVNSGINGELSQTNVDQNAGYSYGSPSTSYSPPSQNFQNNGINGNIGQDNLPSSFKQASQNIQTEKENKNSRNGQNGQNGQNDQIDQSNFKEQSRPTGLYGSPYEDNKTFMTKQFSDFGPANDQPTNNGYNNKAPINSNANKDVGSMDPAKYEFKYEVTDAQSGLSFGHSEQRNGDVATGQYNVVLPDGRKQIVEYEADLDGYRPQIRYEGESNEERNANSGGSELSNGSPDSNGYPNGLGNAALSNTNRNDQSGNGYNIEVPRTTDRSRFDNSGYSDQVEQQSDQNSSNYNEGYPSGNPNGYQNNDLKNSLNTRNNNGFSLDAQQNNQGYPKEGPTIRGTGY